MSVIDPGLPPEQAAGMRLGIMGGTFDPIHYGHLFVAEEARARFALDRVLFVPNGAPPHKKEYLLTAARHRYEMTRLAIADNPAFACTTLELDRTGPSYTVDTLTTLRNQYPSAELFYITGIDAIADILTWRRHAEIIRMAAFIAAARPGFDLKTLQDRLPTTYLERILLLGTTAQGISSTEIRERIRARLPIRYLTPEEVRNYIREHHLYEHKAV
ncbi:MAG: nicotinate-nucleotide adenylyltransferase [Chthonomonadaceae bacterium]|nr:nicotinate-nucleotide adenylyltransferase [Chthonomonadaceae bacterium]